MDKKEIKFRAWNPATRKISVGEITLANAYCFVPGCELMQYTGLKDKNGVEIYESDILRASITSEWDEQVPRNEIAVVEWRGDRYWAISTLTADWHGLGDFKWTIIGNIHENPEMLAAHQGGREK